VRVAYLGTSEYAAVVLRHLAASPYRPVIVVTPPDRRRGRGRKYSPTPVAAAAEELGLPVHRSGNVNSPESLRALEESGANLAMVCAFGQLIKRPLLDTYEFLNVHPSLLPRWRGAAPIERAIMAGDERTGVTIMRLTEGLDSGPVALAEETAIEPGEDYGSLAARLAEIGGDLAVRACSLREAGQLSFSEQDDSQATYAEKIEPEERRLDPNRPAAELERVVRALHPHIGAYLELAGGERLGVRRARATSDGAPPRGELAAHEGRLILGCAEGGLELDVVRPPGGRDVSAADYLRGHPAPTPAA
jgi:methionyl-tRNA formyltransferase